MSSTAAATSRPRTIWWGRRRSAGVGDDEYVAPRECSWRCASSEADSHGQCNFRGFGGCHAEWISVLEVGAAGVVRPGVWGRPAEAGGAGSPRPYMTGGRTARFGYTAFANRCLRGADPGWECSLWRNGSCCAGERSHPQPGRPAYRLSGSMRVVAVEQAGVVRPGSADRSGRCRRCTPPARSDAELPLAACNRRQTLPAGTRIRAKRFGPLRRCGSGQMTWRRHCWNHRSLLSEARGPRRWRQR